MFLKVNVILCFMRLENEWIQFEDCMVMFFYLVNLQLQKVRFEDNLEGVEFSFRVVEIKVWMGCLVYRRSGWDSCLGWCWFIVVELFFGQCENVYVCVEFVVGVFCFYLY